MSNEFEKYSEQCYCLTMNDDDLLFLSTILHLESEDIARSIEEEKSKKIFDENEKLFLEQKAKITLEFLKKLQKCTLQSTVFGKN